MDKKIEILDRLRLKLDGKKRLSNELTYLHDRIKKIKDFEEQLSGNEKKKNKADLLEKEIEDLREKSSELKVLAERRSRDESELRIERDKKAGIEKEISEILSQGSKILKINIDSPSMLESEKDKKLSSLEKEIRAVEKEKDKNLKIFGETEAQIVSLNRSLEEISSAEGTCPVCGRELRGAHKESLIKHHSSEVKALKKDVENAKGVLQNLKHHSDSLEKKREAINLLNIDVFREKQRLLDDSVKKISLLEKNLEGYKSSLEKLARLSDKLVLLKKEYSGLLPYRDRYNAALNFLRKELPEKEKLENRMRGLEKEIEVLEEEIGSEAAEVELDLASLSPEYERLKKDLRSARNSQMEHEKKVASNQAALEQVKKRIEELKDEIRALEEQVKERRSLKAFKALLERIRHVFHKDRLQKELRVRARPLIEEYTRDVFLSFNLPYSDVTLTDDYSIIVHGPNGEERVDMLSGGERIAAALALRVGLSRALSGQRLELLILDEPTIHLDSQRRRELVDIIKNLSLIPQTIVVTHDKEFEEAADRVIEVEKINGVSRVK